MDQRYRSAFNAHYTPASYQRVLSEMADRLTTPRFEFRIAETALLLPPDLRDRCVTAAQEILTLIRRPAIIAAGRTEVPAAFDTPRGDALPHFVAIDLAIVEGPDGRMEPRLIELQGFSSVYAMQLIKGDVYGAELARTPGLPQHWSPLFSGLDRDGYLALLRRTVIHDADPAEVILLDLDPWHQKTRPDFQATARLLGVRAVCVSELKREGRQLYAPHNGHWVPVRRIFHRVVFDELERRRIPMAFDYRDDLDVVWCAHPSWYWIWSKATLPLIDHPAVPWTRRLSSVTELPPDLSGYILKPLYSFAGQGVEIDLTPARLAAIPAAERGHWLLQEKVTYAPALIAPDGAGVKAEIRMMFLKPDDAADPQLAINLVRLSRGKMHGVDHNKGLDWVGSTVALWPM